MLQYLVFAVTEAFTSLWRSRMLNLLSIGTVMFAMFILGSFLFVGLNLKTVTLDWQKQIQFNVFLKDQATEGEKAEIELVLTRAVFVSERLYISKDDAQAQFGRDFPVYEDAADALKENPFPASYQVRLLEGVGRESFEKLKSELSQLAGVDEVYYDQEIFERLESFAGLIQVSGWFFGSIMIFSAIFTISNVLKLTFFTRREEVDIMKLVGASRSYIRGPFIVEGVLIGLFGSCLALLLVFSGYVLLLSYLSDKNFLFGNLSLVFLPLPWLLTLVGAGALSGLFGSMISLSQFLEEHISYQ